MLFWYPNATVGGSHHGLGHFRLEYSSVQVAIRMNQYDKEHRYKYTYSFVGIVTVVVIV